MAGKAKNGNGDSSERRNQILAIAAHLFASGGYSSTTVRDIADEAGILSGSLYHHFASKEAIAREILRSFLDELVGKYEAILAANMDVRATFDALVQASFTTITEQTDSVGLFQNESQFLQAQPGFEFLRERSTRIEEIWRGQIQQGQAEGVFRVTLDTATLYRYIRDAMWMTVRWYRPGGRHTAQTLSTNLLDLLHNGILNESN